jgi:site-specific DNA-methyltransferase (cytosine-N4-specific)
MPQEGLKPKDLCMIPARVALALQANGWYLRSDIIWHKPNPMPESVTDRPTKAHEYLFLLSKSAKYFYDADAILEPFQTSAKENYPARAHITGRGNQGAAAARGNDRDKSGGFPPRKGSGNVTRKLADGSDSRLNTHLGRGVPYEYAEHIGRNRRTVWTIPTKSFKGAHFATFPPKLIEPCILAGSRPGDVVLDPFGGAMTTALVAQEHGRDSIMIELSPAYVKLGKERLAAKPDKLKVSAA